MLNELDISELPEGVKLVNIKEQKVFDDLPFPLILSPSDDFKNKDSNFWNGWVKENLQTIESLLLKYGAILYRGFPIDNPTKFDAFTKAYGYHAFPYDGGFALRKHVLGNVYTSNNAPPGVLIPLHHEMSYVNSYPLILFFYCDIPAKEGGETPMALSNVIYRKMAERDPDFVKRLEKDGLRYVRVAPDGDDVISACGSGWQPTFFTHSKDKAERKAQTIGFDVEWLEDGSMKTITKVLPAIRVDKRTGKKMWFNSVIICHLAWQDARNDGTKRRHHQRWDD